MYRISSSVLPRRPPDGIRANGWGARGRRRGDRRAAAASCRARRGHHRDIGPALRREVAAESLLRTLAAAAARVQLHMGTTTAFRSARLRWAAHGLGPVVAERLDTAAISPPRGPGWVVAIAPPGPPRPRHAPEPRAARQPTGDRGAAAPTSAAAEDLCRRFFSFPPLD